jgi:hypothetical protein
VGRIANLLWSLAVGVLLAAAGLATSMSKLLVVGLAIAATAALFSLLDWWNRPTRRVFLEAEITRDFLEKLFEDRTTIQAEKATKIYLGKWVSVSGVLKNVDRALLFPNGRKATISSRDGSFNNPLIFCNFNRGGSKLEVLHKGDVLKVQGRIDHIDSSWVRLSRCELIEVVSRSPSGG